jgi:hypothetical protein
MIPRFEKAAAQVCDRGAARWWNSNARARMREPSAGAIE